MAFDHTGKVTTYKPEKKFGFVKLDTGDDVFFHISACSRNITPKPGDRVRGDVEKTEKGFRFTRMVME